MTVFASPRSERYLFESWCNAPGLVTIPRLPGTATYASRSLQRSWGAWQARAALTRPQSTHEPMRWVRECASFDEPRTFIEETGWIRVADRVPQIALPVLVVIADKRTPPRIGMATHWQLGKGFSGTDPEWMEGSNAFISAKVTHWMPLSLPPAHETQLEGAE